MHREQYGEYAYFNNRCEGSKGMQKLVIKNVSKFLMCEASMEVALK